MDFVKKLLSRKFLTGLLLSGLLVFEKTLGLDLGMETKRMIAGIAATWILGESYIDAQNAGGGATGIRDIGARLAEIQKLIAPYLPEGVDLGSVLRDMLKRLVPPESRGVEPMAARDIEEFLKQAQPQNMTVGDVQVTICAVSLSDDVEDFDGLEGRVEAPISSDKPVFIGGITAGRPGRRIRTSNTGKFPIVFRHQSQKSAECNQISCPGNSDFTLQPSCACELRFHGATQKWALRFEPKETA